MARKRAKKPDVPADPLAWMTAEQRERHQSLLKRLLVRPVPYGSHGFQVLYVMEDDSGEPETMVWYPADAAEEREIRAFHDAAHGLGPFARPVNPGEPARRSTDEWALIRAILANRADATGYLVYADYLTEHDDPQGEIIRLSVEMDRMAVGDTRYGDVEERRDDLVCEHAEHLYRDLSDIGLRPIQDVTNEFEPLLWLSHYRGVIDRVTIDRPGVLPGNAGRLFAAAPFLRELAFEKGHLDPAGLAKVKQLAQIDELDLSYSGLTADGLRALLRSKYLTGLKTLDVDGNDIGDDGARELAKWPGLAKLESLDVSSCGLQPGGVRALGQSAGVANLKRLRIGRNPGADGARPVLESRHLTALTELELGGTEFFPEIASWFALAPFAKSLEHLDLDSATFQPGAFEALTRCKLPALRVLKLNSVSLRLPAAAHLAGAAFRATLEELYLDNCSLGTASGNFFYQAKFPKLTTLDASRNRLGRDGAGALADAAKNFPALTNLRLWDNRLTPQAIATLARSKVLANLTDLDLSSNKIGPAGAVALAKSKYLTKLTSLTVDEKAVGRKGKAALLDRFGEDVVSFR